MNIAFKELNQDGELILNDKYGDDVEITESGTVDCTELKINKTTVITSGRALQNVTISDLERLKVGTVVHISDSISSTGSLNLQAAEDVIVNPEANFIVNGATTINASTIINGNLDLNDFQLVDTSEITTKRINIGGANKTTLRFYNDFLFFANSVPANDINVTTFGLNQSQGQQIGPIVTLFGTGILDPTNFGQLCSFDIELQDCPRIANENLFTGYGFKTKNITQGVSDHFGCEVVGMGIGSNPIIRFAGMILQSAESGHFYWECRYKTVINL